MSNKTEEYEEYEEKMTMTNEWTAMCMHGTALPEDMEGKHDSVSGVQVCTWKFYITLCTDYGAL